MNLTDLRGELDTRSRPGENLIGAVRLAAVHHRVRATKRRRVVVGGATTLIVIVAAMTGSGFILSPTTPGPYWGAVDSVDGFARYAAGSLLVATATSSLPGGGEVALTTQAGDLGFTFAQRCEVEQPEQVMVSWSIDGQAVGGFSCRPSSVTYYSLIGVAWKSLGVPSGRTVRVTAKLRERSVANRPVDLGRGRLAVALMRRVPVEQYPFPSPPPTLTPLVAAAPPDPKYEYALRLVDSDPADPNATRTMVVEEPGAIDIRLAAQTPGSIEVLLNGVPACTAEWWDYAAGVFECPNADDLSGARPVTVTLVPQRMRGAWRATIKP
jgi:hypothetical protein